MKLQTKALYSLLRLNHGSDPSLVAEDWQIEDLRLVSTELLWKRLEQMGLNLSMESFRQFAEDSDSPEDLAEILLSDCQDSKQYDAAYLVIFELWRRLFPERQTLSIFCDELDHRISLYYGGDLDNDEPIQDALSNLDEILSENVDAGVKPAVIFNKISSYCAHDLMAFIIDYISNLLDAKNERYASELIEDFAPYSPSLIWFDFLRARLLALTDPAEANRMIAKLLEYDDLLAIDLLFEMLRFQIGYGERPVFIAVIQKIVPRLETQEDFKELLMLSSEYFHRRDREDLEAAVAKILKNQNLDKNIKRSDPGLRVFEKLIEDHFLEK